MLVVRWLLMNTIFEVGYDEADRLLLLAEDVQRWLASEADAWGELAVANPVHAVTYLHTATVLVGLISQLDSVDVSDSLALLLGEFDDPDDV